MCPVRSIIPSGRTISTVCSVPPNHIARSCRPREIANSVLFTKHQRNAVLMSNAGILAMIVLTRQACLRWGAMTVIKFYGIPWLCVTHWYAVLMTSLYAFTHDWPLALILCRFIMITYLHHTDPALPHYRQPEWNFQRGAAATVDRNFLGWMGRFFLHDVAHYHVIHHFFPKMPFCQCFRTLQHAATDYLSKTFRSRSGSDKISTCLHRRALSLLG